MEKMEDKQNEQKSQESASQVEMLLDAAIELLAVAELRGDNDMPHPADDNKLWTARMGDAWNELQEQVSRISPNAVYNEVVSSRKYERPL